MGQDTDRKELRNHDGRGAEGQKRLRARRPLRRSLFLTLAAAAAIALIAHEPDAPAAKFDQARAWRNLIAQTDMGPRYPGSEAHVKMKEWLVEESKKHTPKVSVQQFIHRWSKTGETITMFNVVAEMDFGREKTVLLLAHWDTRPTADEETDPARRRQPIVGANDGASGVAVLLELMRVFKEEPPPVNVTFLFTDGEDLGPGLDEMFLGAKHFAKNLPRPRPAYGILLDMVGDKDLVIPKERNSYYYARDLLERFFAHAHTIGVEKHFPNRFGLEIYDDHLPLNEAGIPTINLIDFDYDHWHKLSDTPDKCSPESLGVVGRAVESFLRSEKP